MEKRLTGSQLKTIAMISMFIDHLAATVLLSILEDPFAFFSSDTALVWLSAHWDTLVELYYVLRYIGRFAFPLYCFLLVEGFTHTRSVPKYALRLGLFCLLSEIPFDLAFNGSVLEFTSNNVFFTLLAGLLTLWAADTLLARLDGDRLAQRVGQVLGVLAVGVCGFCLAEYVLRCDYAGQGVLAILGMYLLRRWPVAAFIAGCGVLCIGNPIEAYALFMVIPIALYSGQRGKAMKLAPYLFYPFHLLVFSLVCLLLKL